MNATNFQEKEICTILQAAARNKLLIEEIISKLPPLGSAEGKLDPIAVAKFFTPDSSWTWYAMEFDGKDTFYGLVNGDYRKLGCFSLSELLGVRGYLGLPVERDLYFVPKPLSELN